ncbi:MAG: GDP-mannose 4,6-dehydratase [Candidatus Levybacteria bacterium]|nr:GDP-mannose 4,6-dehydratase [Candidatus Levybacteria bacterium]
MKINNKKIIVTGGAGFIGSNLVSYLLKKEYDVLVVDNFSTGKIKNLPKDNKNLKIIKADIREKEKMTKIIKDSDSVIHMAVQCVRKSINNPLFVHEVNATGTLNVLEACRINKIKKFIYISSSEVYGTAKTAPMKETHPLYPTTIYGASKLAGEYYSLAYLRTYDLPIVIVRPFNTYGYNEHFEGPYGEVIPRFVLRAINNLPIQIFGDGKQTRDFTFVTDTTRGIYKVLEKGKIGEIYNLARGEEISILEIATLIKKILRVKVKIEFLPERPGDVKRHYADISKAKKELRFKASVRIEEGISRYIEWFNKSFPDDKRLLKYYQEINW